MTSPPTTCCGLRTRRYLVCAARIRALVSDDGRGFEPDGTRPGVGLTSMKERAALIGGALEIRSEYSKGTQVLFRIRRIS